MDEELKEFEDKTKGGFNAKTNLKSGLDHRMVSTETYAKVLDFVEEPSFQFSYYPYRAAERWRLHI